MEMTPTLHWIAQDAAGRTNVDRMDQKSSTRFLLVARAKSEPWQILVVSSTTVSASKRHRPSSSPSPIRKLRMPVRSKRWMLAFVIVVILAAVAVEMFTTIDLRQIPQLMGRLNPVAVLLLTSTLPIFGFPISVVYLVLGARFGPYVGFAAVAGITTVHLLGTYLIAKSFLRAPVLRWLTRHKHQIPEVPQGEGAAIVVVAILVPVLPYFIRNYLLALSGIPLRTYLLVGVPLYTLPSAVTLFLGDLSGQPSQRGFIILGSIYVVKLSICGAIVWWLRKRHKKPGHKPGTPQEAKSSSRTLAAPRVS